jgi:ribosomal protein S18 acetylase RimI-like enzyme
MSQENVERLRVRQKQSQRAFYCAMADGSAGSELLVIDSVQATLVPVREWYSIFNSVVYDHPADLERAHPDLATRYAESGVKAWTVWVPPDEPEAGAILQGRGHVLDSTPMLFAASISTLDIEPKSELDLDPTPTWELVGRINDRAHGVLEPWSMAAVFETMNDPASHLHIACHHGAPAAALIAREHEGDCYFWFVATAPEAQGQGIASELMRHALRDASQRGCTTTTLESTKVAEAMYEHLGYMPLGRYEMWERRTA